MRKGQMSHRENLSRLRAADDENLVRAVNKYLEDSQKDLKEAHRQSVSGVPVCMEYTAIVDDMLCFLYERRKKSLSFTEDTALVAVGGYGRGELNIRSDIDILLMHRGEVSPGLKEFTEAILYVLYDTGLDLGFAMRTPEECISLARSDLSTMTSLLETRFLIGHEPLHEELLGLIKKKLFTKKRVNAFIEEKIEESEKRYAKYGGSVFILEPNVKEGEGGLRDLHTARWILMARDGVHDKPFSMSLIAKRDSEALERGLAFLLWIRNELHFNSSRKTDQLTFDQQVSIAGLLGFKDTPKALAVESFMLEYYAHTSDIHKAYRLIVSRHQYEMRKKSPLWPVRKKWLDHFFYVSRGWLTLLEREALTPLTMVKAFEYIAAHHLDLDQRAKDLFISYIHSHDKKFSISKEMTEAFFAILRSRAPYKALAEMHSIGLLDKLIPEFRDIRHRVQHDLYHIYTVDTHSLFAVREIERLGERYKDELPLLSSIYNGLSDRLPLILAILLHDIGKAAGKGHAEEGARLIPIILKRFYVDNETINLVKFLVKNHLRIANTALYRDMHDRKLIINFARLVGSRERLDMLYLLTFADVKAVGPEVWSKWKGLLFDELYIKAGDVLDTGILDVTDASETIREIKTKVLGLAGAGESEKGEMTKIKALLELLPESYFLANNAGAIIEHLKALREFKGLKPHVLKVNQDAKGAYTGLVICSLDKQGLFAMISGVMAANNIDILGAQITTLKNGLVLDILQVIDAKGRPVTDKLKHKKIDKNLGDVISGAVKVKKLLRRKPSILDRKQKTPVKTRISIDNNISDSMSVIDIHAENKIGLLYDITSAIDRLGLYINIARISTKGSEATDIFYVKDIFGQKVYDKDKLEQITRTIYESIEAESVPDNEKGHGREGRGGSKR